MLKRKNFAVQLTLPNLPCHCPKETAAPMAIGGYGTRRRGSEQSFIYTRYECPACGLRWSVWVERTK